MSSPDFFGIHSVGDVTQCPLWVNHIDQLSLPSFRGGKRVITDYGVKTIKRQTRGTPALSMSHNAVAAAVCGVWRCIPAIPLPLPSVHWFPTFGYITHIG